MTKVEKYRSRVKQAIKTRYNYNKRISEWLDYSFDDTLSYLREALTYLITFSF